MLRNLGRFRGMEKFNMRKEHMNWLHTSAIQIAAVLNMPPVTIIKLCRRTY